MTCEQIDEAIDLGFVEIVDSELGGDLLLLQVGTVGVPFAVALGGDDGDRQAFGFGRGEQCLDGVDVQNETIDEQIDALAGETVELGDDIGGMGGVVVEPEGECAVGLKVGDHPAKQAREPVNVLSVLPDQITYFR